MSLKRTPPTKATSDTNLEYVGCSLPNLELTETKQRVGMSSMKRKHGHTDLQDFKEEIRGMFSNFVIDQNTKLQALQHSLTDIQTQNNTFHSFIETISDKYDELYNEIKTLREERKENKLYIKQLENRIENIERNSCSSKLEIRNVPVLTAKESKEDLIKTLQGIGELLNLQIQTSVVKDVYRGFAKPEKVKPIIVEFNSVLLKENIIKNAKKDSKTGVRALNTTRLKIKGPEKPIFIGECLTTKARRLFFLSRDFAKTYGYSYCWTSYGKIYLRKKEGLPQIRIEDEADLNKLKTIENI